MSGTAVLTRDQVRQVLAEYPIPTAIAATRNVAGTGEWCWGETRCLDHVEWLVQSAGRQSGRRAKRQAIAFDPVVDQGGVKLTDDGLSSDLLTRKLMCIAILNHSCQRRCTPVELRRLCLSFDHFVRHRLSLGIRSNSALTPELYDDYVRRLRDAEISHLVPIASRVSEAADVDRRKAKLDRDGVDRRAPLRLADIAREVGQTPMALQLPGTYALVVAAFGDRLRPRRIGPQTGNPDEPQRSARRVGRSAWAYRTGLEPWWILADLSRRGALPHDPLGFNPLLDRSDSLNSVAARNGIYGTVPPLTPSYFFSLLSVCATWIIEYSGPILEAIKIMSEDPAFRPRRSRFSERERLERSAVFDDCLPVGMHPLLFSWKSPSEKSCEQPKKRMSLNRAIGYLLAACLIAISSFAALSIEEALALEIGCLREIGRGQFELVLPSAGLPEMEHAVPIPAIVAEAIRLLERLTARTRARMGGRRLFRYQRDMQLGRHGRAHQRLFIHFPQDGWMKGFCMVNGLPDVDAETRTPVTGRQLARGFAVAYHFGLPTAPLDALTRFLGQSSVDATRRYIYGTLPGHVARIQAQISAKLAAHRSSVGQQSVRELQGELANLQWRRDVFEDVRIEAFVVRALGVLQRTDMPCGTGGRKFVSEVEELAASVRASVRIGGRNDPDAPRTALLDELRSYARRSWLDRVPIDTAYCRCRPHVASDLAEAECEKRRQQDARPWTTDPDAPNGLPDYSYAGLGSCLDCVHCALFARERARAEGACDRLEEASRCAAGPAHREALRAKLSEMRVKLAVANRGKDA